MRKYIVLSQIDFSWVKLKKISRNFPLYSSERVWMIKLIKSHQKQQNENLAQFTSFQPYSEPFSAANLSIMHKISNFIHLLHYTRVRRDPLRYKAFNRMII